MPDVGRCIWFERLEAFGVFVGAFTVGAFVGAVTVTVSQGIAPGAFVGLLVRWSSECAVKVHLQSVVGASSGVDWHWRRGLGR
jgi:hypothetical protein